MLGNRELATVWGCAFLCDQKPVEDFCAQIRLGIEKDNDQIFWGTFTEAQVKHVKNARRMITDTAHRKIWLLKHRTLRKSYSLKEPAPS
jgi:hypothetical protein